MRETEEFIEGRLKWKAAKNGLSNINEYLFDELDSAAKVEIERLFHPFQIGKPVLVFRAENGCLTIFGTQKVICGNNEWSNCVQYSDIDKHAVGDDPFGVFSNSQPKKEFTKSEQSQILIQDKTGKNIVLHCLKGSLLYSMYNILLMMVRLTNADKN